MIDTPNKVLQNNLYGLLNKKIGFRPYSAGQLLLPKNRGFAQEDRKENSERRRIEIRFIEVGEEKSA